MESCVVELARGAGDGEVEDRRGSIGIEPTSIADTASALYWALTMPPVERREMNSRLRFVIRRHDLRAWFDELLEDIERNAPIEETSAA